MALKAFTDLTGAYVDVPQRPLTVVQTCIFLNIPFDIREVIYRYCLQGSEVTYSVFWPGWTVGLEATRTYKHFRLLLTCLQMAQESIGVYYQVTHHRLNAGFTDQKILKTLHFTLRQNLRSIELPYQTATHLASLLDDHFPSLETVRFSGIESLLWLEGTAERAEWINEESVARELEELLRGPLDSVGYREKREFVGVFELLAKRSGI